MQQSSLYESHKMEISLASSSHECDPEFVYFQEGSCSGPAAQLADWLQNLPLEMIEISEKPL
jgi:hypothetical protein